VILEGLRVRDATLEVLDALPAGVRARLAARPAASELKRDSWARVVVAGQEPDEAALGLIAIELSFSWILISNSVLVPS
jgi:hypothetical protein